MKSIFLSILVIINISFSNLLAQEFKKKIELQGYQLEMQEVIQEKYLADLGDLSNIFKASELLPGIVKLRQWRYERLADTSHFTKIKFARKNLTQIFLPLADKIQNKTRIFEVIVLESNKMLVILPSREGEKLLPNWIF